MKHYFYKKRGMGLKLLDSFFTLLSSFGKAQLIDALEE